jgi:methionine-rich copper-binding protein CopC
VLPLIPLATNEFALGTAVAAQLPIRVSSKAASPLTITATLVRADGTTLPLDRTQAPGRDYAGAAGKVYQVPLPPALAAGNYRVIVESTLGRATVAREVEFSVLPQLRP